MIIAVDAVGGDFYPKNPVEGALLALAENKLLKIVKDITSKGFVRNNYKKNLVDLSDVKINLKGKK